MIKQNAPCVASWTDKKWLEAERHSSPRHGDDLRRLAAFIANAENSDVIAGGFEMLKRKSHQSLKCTGFGQHANIDLAAVIGSDRVQQFRAAHGAISFSAVGWHPKTSFWPALTGHPEATPDKIDGGTHPLI